MGLMLGRMRGSVGLRSRGWDMARGERVRRGSEVPRARMGHTAWRTRRLESDARARVQSDQTTRTRRVQSERVSRPGDDREVRKRRSRTSSEDVESAGEDAREEIRDIKANSSLGATYGRLSAMRCNV